MTSCQHKRISLIGSDESGCRAIRCLDCRSRLMRRAYAGTYQYFVAVEAL
jgi:hypothetical protein